MSSSLGLEKIITMLINCVSLIVYLLRMPTLVLSQKPSSRIRPPAASTPERTSRCLQYRTSSMTQSTSLYPLCSETPSLHAAPLAIRLVGLPATVTVAGILSPPSSSPLYQKNFCH